MNILDGIVQGSQAWLDVRAQHYCASDAAAAMGVSKYKSRSDLMRQKATGYTPDVDAAKQRLFDAGHAAEDAARPLVERILGEELYPCVGTRVVDGLALLSSLDGITIDDSIVWESKQYNKALAAAVRAGDLEPHYWAQLEHALLVTEAEKVYFTTTDGTAENMVGMWYESIPERRAQVIASWKQFDEDLASYQHTEVLPPPVAKPIEPLPALALSFSGEVSIVHNLVAFRTAVEGRIAAINLTPKTDQEFVDGKATVKDLDDAAKKAKDALVRFRMQNADAAEVESTVTSLVELMDKTRLHLDKTIKAKELSRKVEILDEHRDMLAAHIAKLNESIGRPYLPAPEVDWATKIKGMRSFDSMQNTLSTALATAKIAANDQAEKIRANMKYLRDNAADHVALFPDVATIVLKAADDLQSLVTSRIALHKAEEAKKEAAIVHRANCNARINHIKGFVAMAQAKTTSADVLALIEQCNAVDMDGFAEHEAEATSARARTVASMQGIADALARSERAADVAKATAPVVEPPAAPVPASHSRFSSGYVPATARVATAAPVVSSPPSTPPSLSVGQIAKRLGFNLTGDFIKGLGFEAAAHVNNAKLYHESDFPLICRALIQHVEAAIEDATLAA